MFCEYDIMCVVLGYNVKSVEKIGKNPTKLKSCFYLPLVFLF